MTDMQRSSQLIIIIIIIIIVIIVVITGVQPPLFHLRTQRVMFPVQGCVRACVRGCVGRPRAHPHSAAFLRPSSHT